MTSTNLFINLQKEDFKKRLWLIAVGFLLLLLIRPVFLLMSLERLRAYQTPIYKDMVDYLLNFFSATKAMEMIVIVLFAFFLGTSGYLYLFSRSKTDFYHSLPIKREKLFMVFYVNGLLIYLTLYLLSQIICMVIVTAQGFMTGELIVQMINTLLVQSIYFLFYYHTVILAVMLTGNLLVAIAGSGVLILYIPLLLQTIEGYYSQSFKSYYTTSYTSFPGVKVAGISAITSYLRYCDLFYNKQIKNEKEMFMLLLSAFIISVLLLILSIWLYQKRPSEAAEKAMAFKKTETGIRIFIVILVSMLGGILFHSFENSGQFWFWFGLIFTGILVHCVIEVIYSFEFKAISRHKLQLVMCLATASAVSLCFNLDVFGFDSYLPNEDKVASVAVAFSNIDSEMNGSSLEVINGEIVADNSMTYVGYQLRYMKLTDISTVQLLAKKGILALEEKDNKDSEDVSDEWVRYIIKYNLKNGKEIYRTYTCPLEEVLPQVESIYNSKEYKKGAFPLSAVVNSNTQIRKMSVYNSLANKVLTVRSEDAKSLLNIYLKELSDLTVSEIQGSFPILRLSPEIRVDDMTTELQGYYIYPSFKETLAKLEELGMEESGVIVDKLRPEEVTDIIVSGYKGSKYRDEDYREFVYSNDGAEDSTKKIEELCSKFYPSNFAYSNSILKPYIENITFQATFKPANGLQNSTYLVIGKGQMPDFVDKDFDAAKGRED